MNGCSDQGGSLKGAGSPTILCGVLVCLWVVASLFTAGRAAAGGLPVPLKSIAQITVDEDGLPLSYPAFVFYDPVEEEIYVSNGGRSRLVVYGPDFFPRISIGRGRGVLTPRGGLVLSNGEVYICQSRNRNNPRPRITILNGAFFPEREIFLDEIPEAADFVPSQLAISHDGIIYLASASSRGVLVLDSDGNFLRRLEPMDKVSTLISDEEAEEEESSAEDEAFLANIPEEFRPMKSRKVGTSRFREGTGPVKINNVTIDSTGKIYLMSLETSRIYVYGPDEAFLFAFGEKGGTPRHLSQPKSMAIDEKRGLIYVADYMRHSILTYDLAGTYLFEFGGRGDGPGWFNYPNGLAINSQGQLIVADLFNKRVQVLEVGYEAMLTELGLGPAAGAPAAGSGEGEATGQGDFAPGQPGSIAEQVKMPEEGNGAAQDESAAGPPEEVDGEEKALPQPLEPGESGLDFQVDRPEPSE